MPPHKQLKNPNSASAAAQRPKRLDARLNETRVLDAAAALFVTAGVNASVRDIAAKAGVGMGTLYRHYPTRADLIIAVYNHQIDSCAAAGPTLLAASPSPYDALRQWLDLFVDFLITKRGLAAVLQSDDPAFATLHAYFLDRLIPVCTALLQAAIHAGEVQADIAAIELMWGVGSLCASGARESRMNTRRLVNLLVAGLGQASA